MARSDYIVSYKFDNMSQLVAFMERVKDVHPWELILSKRIKYAEVTEEVVVDLKKDGDEEVLDKNK